MTQPIQTLRVDHRYSPMWWQTLICLPDDPVKTLVGREGQFFLDFGSGGPRNFQTSFEFGLVEGSEWLDQVLPDARIPLLVTHKQSKGFAIEETTFLEIPSDQEPKPKAVRYDGFETLTGWAEPSIPSDPAFRDAAVRYPSGSHEASLEVHLNVDKFGSRTIALGFCEGRHPQPGLRRAIAQVEGADAKEIDPVRDFGANVPGVYLFKAHDTDGDGRILISIKYHPDTHFSVETDLVSDLRTIMLSALWSFVGPVPTSERIVAGTESAKADLYAPGKDLLLPHRRNHTLVRVTNPTENSIVLHPILSIDGVQTPELVSGRLRIGPHNWVSSALTFKSIDSVDGEDSHATTKSAGIQGTGGRHWVASMSDISVDAGTSVEFAIVLDRFSRSNPSDHELRSSRDAMADMGAWWLASGPSHSAIELPDPSAQRMVDSCLRNLFQARDERNGLPSFHVGPTIYRGLFLADGAFMLELATMLDRVDESRAGIEYLRSFELPEGGFNVIDTYYKENGLAAFAIIRHAQLTNDREWLKTKWSTIQGCVRRIIALRRTTPKGAPNEGLLPAGAFCDGGVFNNNRPFADYSNVAWCLSGLKWAAEAARWIEETHDAENWQAEYDDFRRTFQLAAEKDVTPDSHGNMYLPVVQGNGDNHAPPRGQWAFCHSVYPGGIYAQGDPIVKGTLAMLHDALVEGVVLDTGWMTGGLWPYFSSFYAHALQWAGSGQEVPQILYDFANHSSPTLVWREEQKPQGMGYEEVGDMPHNWASAEFLRMVLHGIQIDRGSELHLLEGLPREWAAPGAVTRLRGIRTPFGCIDLDVTGEATDVRIRLKFDDESNMPGRVVVHRDSWGEGSEVTMTVKSEINEVVPRAH